MKIKKLTIENFRGIGYAEIDIENFTTLIGPNNIGKSTILSAIHLLLDNKKPKLEDWPGQKASDVEMVITCEFIDLENWEKRKPAISKLLHGETLKIKVHCEWNEEQTDFSYNYFVYHILEEYPHTGINFTDAKKDEYLKSAFESLNISKAAEYKERQSDIEGYIKENNPDLINNNEGWHLKKFANSLQQAIPHVMYVPASFKIEDELKATNNSPFAFLFSNKLFPKVKEDISYQDYIS